MLSVTLLASSEYASLFDSLATKFRRTAKFVTVAGDEAHLRASWSDGTCTRKVM
jgi:hypothetical protein